MGTARCMLFYQGSIRPCDRVFWTKDCQVWKAAVLESLRLSHLRVEGPVGDAADHGAILAHNCDAAVAAVKDKPRNVLLRHVGQLPAEDVLQRDQPGSGTIRTVSHPATSCHPNPWVSLRSKTTLLC